MINFETARDFFREDGSVLSNDDQFALAGVVNDLALAERLIHNASEKMFSTPGLASGCGAALVLFASNQVNFVRAEIEKRWEKKLQQSRAEAAMMR